MPVTATGWWETERATFVRRQIERLSAPRATIVDVGCGRADMLDDPVLSDRIRINVDSHIWHEWQGREGMLFVAARADALPFRDGAFDLVGSFDVLEHISDDALALREQHRICTQSGSIVAAVPADPRLWSAHDEAVGHHRRYTLASFAELADAASLVVQRRSYFYSFLWFPAWLTRKSVVRSVEPGQGSGLISRLVTRSIGVLAALERALIERVTLPVGTSAWFEMSAPVDESRADSGRP